MKYIQVVRQLTLSELIFTLWTMLMGEEGKDWSYYEQDASWWASRLFIGIN